MANEVLRSSHETPGSQLLIHENKNFSKEASKESISEMSLLGGPASGGVWDIGHSTVGTDKQRARLNSLDDGPTLVS